MSAKQFRQRSGFDLLPRWRTVPPNIKGTADIHPPIHLPTRIRSSVRQRESKTRKKMKKKRIDDFCGGWSKAPSRGNHLERYVARPYRSFHSPIGELASPFFNEKYLHGCRGLYASGADYLQSVTRVQRSCSHLLYSRKVPAENLHREVIEISENKNT